MLLNETTSQTQTIPLAQSGDMVQSGLQSQTLPMAQSIQPYLIGDQEHSLPQDTSPQNGLKAEPPPFNFNPAQCALAVES